MEKNDFNIRVNSIIQSIRRQRLLQLSMHPFLYVVKEDGDSSLRLWFLSYLIEDRYEANLSLPQFYGTIKDSLK